MPPLPARLRAHPGLFPGIRGAEPGEWGGCPLKSVVGVGVYLVEQLMGLHGLYLKVAGRLKIEAFQLGRGCCPSVSPATPGSGPCPWATAGQAGQGHSPSNPGPPHLPSLPQAWAGRGATRPIRGQGERAGPLSRCPLGPSLWAGPAGCVTHTLTPSAGLSPWLSAFELRAGQGVDTPYKAQQGPSPGQQAGCPV